MARLHRKDASSIKKKVGVVDEQCRASDICANTNASEMSAEWSTEIHDSTNVVIMLARSTKEVGEL